MARTKRSEAAAKADGQLRYWGFHAGKQFAADGYPAECPLLMLLSGHSDLNPLSPKFGVNVKDIPGEAWRVNALVMRIHGDHRKVLIARYCLPVDYYTGQPIEPRVIAEVLALTTRTYYRRLEDARQKFLLLSAGVGEKTVSLMALRPCAESMT